MNDRKIKELISEFKKLSDAKFNMNNLIGLSNYKLRENYIKSNQFDTSLNIIPNNITFNRINPASI